MRKRRDDSPNSPARTGEGAPGILASRLPIRIDDLLHARVVEIERIEFKAGWNPDPILRTLCAFANDFENLGGGYLVIGQDCKGMCFPFKLSSNTYVRGGQFFSPP